MLEADDFPPSFSPKVLDEINSLLTKTSVGSNELNNALAKPIQSYKIEGGIHHCSDLASHIISMYWRQDEVLFSQAIIHVQAAITLQCACFSKLAHLKGCLDEILPDGNRQRRTYLDDAYNVASKAIGSLSDWPPRQDERVQWLVMESFTANDADHSCSNLDEVVQALLSPDTPQALSASLFSVKEALRRDCDCVGQLVRLQVGLHRGFRVM